MEVYRRAITGSKTPLLANTANRPAPVDNNRAGSYYLGRFCLIWWGDCL